MVALALAIGAFIGTLCRYGIGQWIGASPAGFPTATLSINLLGCLFLGWFFTIVLYRIRVSPAVRIGIGTGFTGSFTTFSTFSVETVNLVRNGCAGLAAGYVLASLIGGVLFTALGFTVAKRQSRRAKEGTAA
ncbi:fluoride efflux transporter CrcB [Cohnella candidum]|uniref:Fluoride-specific ion channel FluC n=1 Tax=Cohnella candidum TaxID=2674991 RepID=A0A3G3K2E6_9BACL|nr:fluoride efflux transporter CrcB [Cohnella candidum]AYQ74550.1 fluoride efflux transporter CrcB [Cohnella candidum]